MSNPVAKVQGLLAVLGLGTIVGGSLYYYQNKPPLPPLPPVEKRPEPKRPETAMRTSADFYKALIIEDAKKFGVGATPSTVAEPNPYFLEHEMPRRLAGKEHIQTPHLDIEASIEKQVSDQGLGADQFILTIKNRTASHIAYHVVTEVVDPRSCRNKSTLPQNAIALRPHEKITRIECYWSRGFFAILQKVEVMEIPSISYYYLSRLYPQHVLYDERTSSGHQPPMGKSCELVPWRDIRTMAEAGDVGWADVIDFYARHNCDEYNFFRGYKQRKRPDEPLPARPEAAAPK